MQSLNINLVKRIMKAGRRDFFFQYLLLFVFLIFCIYQYSAHRLYGFSIYPDEFGYWASAAQWLGYDWSNVASLGYYYSFGYSLLLTPILWFCHDSITAYRVAVFVNMSLQCISIGLLWGIFKRLSCPVNCGAEEVYSRKMQTVFAAGVAVFYPAWTFYTQMTLAEALLAFLYIFICYQFILLLEDWKIGNVMIRILLLSIAFLYLHFVHMRTVGVVAAAVLVLTCYLWHRPEYRRLLFAFAAVLMIGAAVGLWLKGVVTDTVYATADARNLAVNDYTGKLRILKELFTWNGMKQFLQSCAGKLYYLGMASFGLFYPALGRCIKRTAVLLHGIVRQNAEIEKRKTDWFYFFLFLSMLGQFMVVAVSVRGSRRLDRIVYGRYNEYLLPVFMGIGILVLLNARHLLRIFGCSVGISSALFLISLRMALHSKSTVMRGVFATGLNYLSKNTYAYQVLPEFAEAYLFGLLLMAVLYGSIWLGRHFKQNSSMMMLVLLMELLLTICLCRKYIWTYNDFNFYDLKVCEYIEEYEAENADTPVWYLHGGRTNYIDLIQFTMRDKQIEILEEQDASGAVKTWELLEQSLPEAGFLITDARSPYVMELEKKYVKCVESNSFVLFLAE